MSPDLIVRAALIGAVAIVVFDVWNWSLQRFFGVRVPRWAILGRWILAPMRLAAPAGGPPGPPIFSPAESLVGTVAHYLTGVAFAAVLLFITGPAWAESPTALPALVLGVGTIVFPFLVIMPKLGLGVAAARAPQPNRVRVLTLLSHVVFGLGFYLGAFLAAHVL